MINDKLKCIFVEVPKTGSTSVRSVIGNPKRPHKSISQIKFMVNEKKFESYFKFGFVRNPWDRILSAYFWYKGGGVQNKADKKIGKNLPWRFKKFIKNYEKFISEHDNELSPHFLPQVQIINNPNELDFIGKFENLEKDFSYVCKELGLDNIKLPHSNKSKHKPYWRYY